MQSDKSVEAPCATAGGALSYRKPMKADGAKIWDLVRRIDALDDNSMYCNLLQCSHFAGTSALAELAGPDSADEPVGWVSGYLPPGASDTLFIWQIAVHSSARGRGVAKGLIHEVLKRPECRQVRRLHSTITPGNKASWALFRAIAADLDAPMTDDAHFEREAHFDGAHATEHLVEIGPFDRIGLRRAA